MFKYQVSHNPKTGGKVILENNSGRLVAVLASTVTVEEANILAAAHDMYMFIKHMMQDGVEDRDNILDLTEGRELLVRMSDDKTIRR